MIITAVANVIFALLNVLFVFELPVFPAGFVNIFNSFMGFVGTGIDILHVFFGNTAMGIIGICLQFVIYANVAYFIISVIFFVLKMIPFLGLGD